MTARERCIICGSDAGSIEHHHVGRSAYLAATVNLCRSGHVRQTIRQRDAGAFRALNSDEQRVWSILHGILGLLVEQARGLGLTDLAVVIERQHRAALLLLSALSDEPIGPDPLANSVRPGRALRKTSRPAVAADDAADAGERLAALTAGILPAVAAAASELAPDAAHGQAARTIAAGADRLAAGLVALEDHPRVIADMITAALQATTLGSDVLTRLVGAACAGDADTAASDPRLDADLHAFEAAAAAQLDFALSLATDKPTNGSSTP